MESGDFYDFGPFRLDGRKRLLLRDSQPVALTPKALETLLLLVANSQRVLEKDELMKKLWPDAFVEEANLAQNISALRKALGESPSDHHFIVTVPGRGYRFVAEVRKAGEALYHSVQGEDAEELVVEKRTVSQVIVEEGQSESEAGESALAARGADARSRELRLPPYSSRSPLKGTRLLALFAAATLVLGGIVVKLLLRQSPPSLPELSQRQLTSNPIEAPLLGAAISPDGKLLAYIDRTGIFLRTIQTGEVHSVPFIERFTPSLYSLSWFPDGTRLLVGGRAGGEDTERLWVASIFGETPRELREGIFGAVSPDGSRIAYVSPDLHAIWLMGADGETPHGIVAVRGDDFIQATSWAPSGQRIAFALNREGDPGGEIETCDVNGGGRTEVLRGIRLPWEFSLAWIPGGRIIYSFQESQEHGEDDDLWEVRLSPETSVAAGPPRRLTNWPRSRISNLTLTADGKRLAFLRSQTQADVYVGELKRNGVEITPPRRLTLSDAFDWPQGWTRDSRAVLFHSDRRGTPDIFEQDIKGGAARAIVAGPDDETYPRSSPDGQWVLYWAHSRSEGASGFWRLMRVPSSGGPPEFVLKASMGTWFRCPTRAGARCVLGEKAGGSMVFFALDPLSGKGAELQRVDLSPGEFFFWDLPPDGSQVVTVGPSPGGFKVVALGRGATRSIVVRGWRNLYNVVWTADGKGFFAFTQPRLTASLLKIDFSGNARLLWESDGTIMNPLEPVPSPDGKFLAFAAWTGAANAWMLDNF